MYTSRGMTASNQFKVHGQLPLYGMTVGNIWFIFDHNINSDVSFSSEYYITASLTVVFSPAALPVFSCMRSVCFGRVPAASVSSPDTNCTFTQTGAPLFCGPQLRRVPLNCILHVNVIIQKHAAFRCWIAILMRF